MISKLRALAKKAVCSLRLWHAKWVMLFLGFVLTLSDAASGDMEVTWFMWFFIAWLISAIESITRFELDIVKQQLEVSEQQLRQASEDYDALHDRHLAYKQQAEDHLAELRASVDSKQKWIDDLEDTIKSVHRTTEGIGKF